MAYGYILPKYWAVLHLLGVAGVDKTAEVSSCAGGVVGLSKSAGRILEAILVLGATALFTYIGFLLIAGISHSGDDHGGGNIIAGVVLLFP